MRTIGGGVLMFCVLLLTTSFVVYGQKENKFIRSGNSSFNNKEYNAAEIDYRKALEINPASQSAIFNLGTALYKQDNMQEAAKSFETLAANNSMNPNSRSDAFYNLGNTLLKNKNYKESIECYKNALRLNPNNEDARYNLAYAKQFINNEQNQDQQNKQDKQDQQNQDQNKKDEQKQDQQNQDQQKQDQDQQKQDQNQQKQDQNQQKQDQNQQKQDQNQQKQQPKELTRKEAEKMLEALKNNEKDSREKVKLEEVKAVRLKSSDKDW